MTPIPSSVLRPSYLPGLRFHRPDSLHELLRLLDQGAHPIAGGTDILLTASHHGKPDELAWTGAIDELDNLETGSDLLRIGAAVNLTRLVRSAEFRSRAPAVADGAGVIGSVQMRNQGSLTGNVCSASPAGDTLPGLLVHDAVIETAHASGGKRSLMLEDFLVAPGVNILLAGELVTDVSLCPLEPGEASAFKRYTARQSLDLAFASAAVRISFEADGLTVSKARLALGAVGPCAFNAVQAAETLVGKPLIDTSLSCCADAAAESCSPISDHRASAAYRRQLIKVLVNDVLIQAHNRAVGGLPAANAVQGTE